MPISISKWRTHQTSEAFSCSHKEANWPPWRYTVQSAAWYWFLTLSLPAPVPNAYFEITTVINPGQISSLYIMNVVKTQINKYKVGSVQTVQGHPLWRVRTSQLCAEQMPENLCPIKASWTPSIEQNLWTILQSNWTMRSEFQGDERKLEWELISAEIGTLQQDVDQAAKTDLFVYRKSFRALEEYYEWISLFCCVRRMGQRHLRCHHFSAVSDFSQAHKELAQIRITFILYTIVWQRNVFGMTWEADLKNAQ